VRAAILGGGISGCALAAELGASGRLEVVLVERGPRLGGLHRSVRIGPHVFDIGAFVFGDDHALFSLFPEVRADFLRVPNRYGSIRAGGVLDDYPCTLGGIHRQFGSWFLARVVLEILFAKARHWRRDRLRTFVAYYLGPTLYRVSGLQRYVERLYLAPDTEIDVEFAEKRLAAVAGSASVRAILLRLARELARGRWPRGLVRPLTADEVWVRPPGGFDEVYARIARNLRGRGVDVRCDASVRGIEARGAGFRLAGLAGDEVFDHVFSTIPLEVLAGLLGLTGFVAPPYVDLYSLFYEHEGPLRFPYNVLHNFTEHGQWKRLTVTSRYYATAGGVHAFTVEGTARPGPPPDSVGRAGLEDFERWARRERLFDGPLRALGYEVTPRGYPVYRTSAARGVRELKERIRARGLRLAGRQGDFNYLSSSDAAGDAVAVARAFLGEAEAAADAGAGRRPSR
jgi:hypothetical protein